MIHDQSADTLTVWAPAKLNLFLEVLSKRPDGYHEIATLMVAVSLFDILAFREERSGNILLQCDTPELSTGPDNLIIRAAELLRQKTGCLHGAWVRLQKRIPWAAGLGGGSSDAAAALHGLNRLWRLNLNNAELAAVGAELGSDVPFFFHTPAAWCTGRGERVASAPLGQTLDFLLVCPRQELPTAEVYRNVLIPQQPRNGQELRQAAADGDVAAIGLGLYNRLQPAAESICPEVKELNARLAGYGPAGHAMSGSGSSLFALCNDRRQAVQLARRWRQADGDLRQPLPRVFLVRSCA